MPTESIEAGQDRPLRNALELLGGWPVLEAQQWKPKKFSLWDVLIKLRRLGFNHNILIKVAVEADERNNTINVIKVIQINPTLPTKLDLYTCVGLTKQQSHSTIDKRHLEFDFLY